MILFLDIDGVCHPVSLSGGTFCCLQRLEGALRRYPVDIVISSVWRTDHSLVTLQGFFSADIASRIIDTTPDFYIPGLDLDYRYVREKEIKAWLMNNERGQAEWLAIDDCDWLFTPGCKNLLLIDGQRGFDQAAEALLYERMSSSLGY